MDLIRESSLAQYLIEQEIEENKEQWLKQGIEQGERKSTLAGLLEVLGIRFGLQEADPLFGRIADIDDLQRLKQLLRAAIQATSLEAFEHMLDDV
ncbi:MAG: hypothetical protein F4Y39_17430 [Gemmatimonadetes bacterium]|nr:hypothetical protein [Gemmatimonadota bacterium]MYF73134.1 hypothetical protein [Gemmatimonadota bacterium]MYK52463.1 hypothetical protein [Gemmatimonadota bacterium]